MPRTRAKPAVQARSQRTAARLLESAEDVLEKSGLEGFLVPEIAKRAGVSPASIYRRFTDKDGLIREVFERFFARSLEANREALDPECWRSMSLDAVVYALVGGMVTGYAQRPGLLRAVLTYGEQHADAAFRRRALALRKASFSGIEKILFLHAKEIKHPSPQRAVAFGLQLVALALRERAIPMAIGHNSPEISVAELQTELSRFLLAYLRFGDRFSSPSQSAKKNNASRRVRR
jgi:AcrR family transcriptional regulator